jgi:hypothetical protein
VRDVIRGATIKALRLTDVDFLLDDDVHERGVNAVRPPSSRSMAAAMLKKMRKPAKRMKCEKVSV